jgi:hypothetical protein
MSTPTHTARAIATAFAVLAIAIAATPATAEPKNGVPFVTPTTTADGGTVALAGPRYTPQELKALIAYSKASFAEKKALLAAAEPKNGVPFVTPTPTASFAGEAKNAVPFTTQQRGALDALVLATIRRHLAAGKLGSTIVHHPTAAERIIAQERGRQGDPLVFGLPQQQPASVQIVQRPGGFDWGDAGIGGAATLALVLLVAGGAALRHDSRQEAHG